MEKFLAFIKDITAWLVKLVDEVKAFAAGFNKHYDFEDAE